MRHRLPDSLDHMLTFVYLTYSMMALLMESVPSFEETWIECLGDLARYRMACCSYMDRFCSLLDNHIGRVTVKSRAQGLEIASSLCAATFDSRNANAFLSRCFRDQEDLKKAHFLASRPRRPGGTSGRSKG
jgi:hypothetical protein